jgi:phosphomannomutase
VSKPLIFGTDGWRAIIADEYTFDNVRRCAKGVAELIKRKGLGERGIVIGYDLRFESEDFAAAAASAVNGAGVKVYLCGRSEPTPVISRAVLTQRAGAGITITASHNPPNYNGFKVRSDYGGAANPETIAELEQIIAATPAERVETLSATEAERRGLLVRIEPAADYLTQLADLVDFAALRQAKLRVVVDAMYGSGLGWYPRMLSGGSVELVEINGERNPSFGGINPEPISKNLQKLFATVRSVGATVGLATDGDADRLGVCDENGHFVDQLRVYSLLALYLLEVRGWRGPIVKTLSTSSMLDQLGALYGVPVYETGVGFKYVAPKMVETGAMIGGEESGGYAYRGHIPERDGIVSGLFMLDLMVKLGKTPSQLVELLFERVGPHFYNRIDVRFPATERAAIQDRLAGAKLTEVAGVTVDRILSEDGFKYVLSDASWLLIRFSGTEPIMRFYAEAGSDERVNDILEAGRTLAGV